MGFKDECLIYLPKDTHEHPCCRAGESTNGMLLVFKIIIVIMAWCRRDPTLSSPLEPGHWWKLKNHCVSDGRPALNIANTTSWTFRHISVSENQEVWENEWSTRFLCFFAYQHHQLSLFRDSWLYMVTISLFSCKVQNFKKKFRHLHRDLNLDEIKNALYSLSVNRETNLMNLIRP